MVSRRSCCRAPRLLYKWGLMNSLPKSLGELRRSQWSVENVAQRSVRQELRENLLCKLEKGDELFPGVHGYDDTVLPQIINAILSRHHFILLGSAWPGEVAHPARPGGFHGPAHPGDRGLRNSRQSLHSDLPRLPRTSCR